jgi:PAS domain S-box-containing protein
MQWNIILLVYIAVTSTVFFIHIVSQQRWKLFSFLRKETLETLEKKLYSYDQSANAIMIVTEDQKVVSVNETLVKMFGWKETEFVGDTLERIIPDRFRIAHNEGMRRVKGRPMDDRKFILQAVRKNREEFTIELLLRKRKNDNTYFYTAIIRDITEEVEKTKVYNEEIANLLKKIDILHKGEEIGNNGSWYWDLKTSSDLNTTKLTTSEGYKRIVGLDERKVYDAQYIKGKVWSEDEPIVNAALEQAFNGEGYDISYRMIRQTDFKVIYIRSIVRPVIDNDGMVIGLYGSTKLLQTSNIVDAIKQPVTPKLT